MENVLEVRNLSVTFHAITGEVQAVRDISFDLHKGSVTAIVGESGCGKSVTSKSIMGLIKKPGEISPESKIIFQGENIQEYTKKQWEEYRGQKCSICFQDALTALNPTMTIGKQIMEKIRVHKKVTKKEAWNEAVHMLELVGIPIPDPHMEAEKQRIKMGGEIPSPIDPPAGCRFQNRCKYATDRCREAEPKLRLVGEDHYVACHRCGEE